MRGTLYLVNRAHPLAGEPEAEALVPVDGGHSRIMLHQRARVMLEQLLTAVDGRGAIVPVSGYRPRSEQQAIWDGSLAEHGQKFTETYVARPGCSEHQTGLAIDLGLNQGEVDFLRPAFPYDGICQAFRDHMARFGFIQRYPAGKEAVTGIGHEPWHFRYVGRPHALRMAARGFATLEEYLPWLAGFPWAAGGLRDAFGEAAGYEGAESFNAYLAVAIVADALCGVAFRLPAQRMGDEYQQLVGQFAADGEVVAVAQPRVLQGIDDDEVGRLPLLQVLDQLAYRHPVQ